MHKTASLVELYNGGGLEIHSKGDLTKTGAGTLQILAEAEGLVEAESFVISSGRLDYKGFFKGSLIVTSEDSQATFSPGNSVGTANVNGNVIIENGIALFEFGEYSEDDDSDHDVLNITNGRFSVEPNMIMLDFGNGSAQSWAIEGNEYLLVSGGGFSNGDYTSLLNNYSNVFKLYGKGGNLYLGLEVPEFDPEPVPEPSTWALLVLGVAALFLRKRVRS